MAIFKGAGVAIVTPMKENQDVNYDKLEELINQQIDAGTDAIVIAGTTGESSTLTMEEHHDVIKAAVEFTKHRVPVVAGTGSNCTRTAIQLSQEAEEAIDRNTILQQGNTGRTDQPLFTDCRQHKMSDHHVQCTGKNRM